MLIMFKVKIMDESQNYGEISDSIEVCEVSNVSYKCGIAIFDKSCCDPNENTSDNVFIPMTKENYFSMCKTLFDDGKADLTAYEALDFKFSENYWAIDRDLSTNDIREQITSLLRECIGILS